MRIGELAEQARVSTDTIRYYERVGLLTPPARGPNRYRDYGHGALEDMQFIKKAQLLGLKLDDVRTVLEISAGGQLPCDHVRSVVEAHLADVEQKLRALRELRATLKTTMAKLNAEPKPTTGCRCAVNESSTHSPEPGATWR